MAAEASRLVSGADGTSVPSAGPAAEHDREETYCRRLGHHLSFAYCRRAEGGQVCPRVLDCWYERPAVLEGLRGGLNAAEPASPPAAAGKIESILAIVARVRERQEGAGAAP